MKLKSVLVLAFLALTLIPIAIVTGLLYKSGFELSKQSYTRNLVESLLVQEDYIAQTIENNMISDYRFANKLKPFISEEGAAPPRFTELLASFKVYLEASEDKTSVCILLNKAGERVYALGEKDIVADIIGQLPDLPLLGGQVILEFRLEKGVPSLGLVTPLRDAKGTYLGSFISVYTRHYMFKIISSYYKITHTSTYLCRKDGEIIDYRKLENPGQEKAIREVLANLPGTHEGLIDTRVGSVPVLGYYKNIHNSPWYLVGFVDDALIYAFTNRFVWVYLWIVIGVMLADVALALYVSQKVVEPINDLIRVMDGYQNRLSWQVPEWRAGNSYVEIRYLRATFADLMKTILRVRHNFEGVYQLYQSNDMGDINIDIDPINQTITSNKNIFQDLMNQIDMPEEACIVERFARCFCEKDRDMLMELMTMMRDQHLAVAREAEVHTPFLDQKWFHCLVVPMYEDVRLSRLFVQLRDVSNFKRQQLASLEEAQRDPLTGLYNRNGFIRRVTERLEAPSGPERHVLLFADMDFFKLVNDTFGHRKGDELLCSVAASLTTVVGPDGLVARFGGDEFVAFLPGADEKRQHDVCRELAQQLVFPFDDGNVAFTVSASIGLAVWKRSQPGTIEELLHQADADMYEAKRAFKQGKLAKPRQR